MFDQMNKMCLWHLLIMGTMNVGGNHAMVDAIKLAQGLTKVYRNEISLADAVTDFEEEMIPRGSDAVLSSREATQFFHGSLSANIAMAESFYASFLHRIEAHKKRIEKDLE